MSAQMIPSVKQRLEPVLMADCVDQFRQALSRASIGLDYVSDSGQTLLHLAAGYNSCAIARYLVEQGASLNTLTEVHWTPLLTAVTWGYLDITIVLLELGADPNIPNEHGRGPLHKAAYLDRPDIVEALLHAGADPSLGDEDARTPLQCARRRCAPLMSKQKIV